MKLFESNRNDYENIVKLIKENTSVLDLGCGDGELLYLLEKHKKVKGAGVEISEDGVRECVKRGLTVYQGDITTGLSEYGDNSFDYVLLVQTLQVITRPSFVIDEMLRVGRQAIITFPNMGHWYNRIGFLLTGTMPRSTEFPYDWYENPNKLNISIRDFQIYCAAHHIRILKEKHFRSMVSPEIKYIKHLPNFFAGYGVFIIAKM